MELGRIQTPQLQRVIHAARHNAISTHIKVYGQHLIAMSLHSAQDGNAHVALDVPQSYRMILAARQQKLQLVRMELQLVNGLSVADVVAHRLVLLDINNPDDSAVSSRGQERGRGLQVVRPGAGVKYLIGLGRELKIC